MKFVDIIIHLQVFSVTFATAIDITTNACTIPTNALDAKCHAHITVDSVTNEPIELIPEIQKHNLEFKSQACIPGNFVQPVYGPADLQSAYGVTIPSSYQAGTGPIVAVVVAYDYILYESDLNTYRAFYCLPACTVASGCLTKVNQYGSLSGPYPGKDDGWNQEAALNMQMISAMCPWCKILLVIADSANMFNLGASVKTAADLGK